MKVHVKSFDVAMEVKSKGIELEVRSADDQTQLGDCYITKTGLVWCKGRTFKANGVKISWADFVEICGSDGKLQAAVVAARAAH